jgi:shikimate dehydrogenase
MNPPQTHLLRAAAARGATVLDGRGMLVNQAALNIRYWTGVEVDPAVLRAALDAVLPG